MDSGRFRLEESARFRPEEAGQLRAGGGGRSVEGAEEFGYVGGWVEEEFLAEAVAGRFNTPHFATGDGGDLFGGEAEQQEGAEAYVARGQFRVTSLKGAVEVGMNFLEVMTEFICRVVGNVV